MLCVGSWMLAHNARPGLCALWLCMRGVWLLRQQILLNDWQCTHGAWCVRAMQYLTCWMNAASAQVEGSLFKAAAVPRLLRRRQPMPSPFHHAGLDKKWVLGYPSRPSFSSTTSDHKPAAQHGTPGTQRREMQPPFPQGSCLKHWLGGPSKALHVVGAPATPAAPGAPFRV